jgi:hypothetical protein
VGTGVGRVLKKYFRGYWEVNSVGEMIANYHNNLGINLLLLDYLTIIPKNNYQTYL